jgi:hypothetical protein
VPALRYVINDVVVDTVDGPAQVGALQFVGEADRTVGDILQDASSGIDRSERDEAAEWLVGYLTDHGGEAKASDILKAARADGIAERTLRRARARAGVQSKRSGFGLGAVWWLAHSGHENPHSGHSGQPPCPGTNDTNDGRDGGEQPRGGAGNVPGIGPCVRCGSPTHRYGGGGEPLCRSCRSRSA